MKETKINSHKVKPVVCKVFDKSKVLGGDIIPDPYSNILILSKKKSGKTTLIYNILNKITFRKNSPQKVLFFVGTIFKDQTYKKITDMLEERGCDVIKKTSFLEDDINYVTELIDELKQDDDETEDCELPDHIQETQVGLPKLRFNNDIEITKKEETPKSEPRKPRKKSKLHAEIICVFDDLGDALRHKSISLLAKTLRHYKICCIYSSQRMIDCHPDTIAQTDVCLLFKSFNRDTLDKLRLKLDLHLPEEEFWEIYSKITEKQFQFLYIDVNNLEFRRNFQYKLLVD